MERAICGEVRRHFFTDTPLVKVYIILIVGFKILPYGSRTRIAQGIDRFAALTESDSRSLRGTLLSVGDGSFKLSDVFSDGEE